MTREAIQFITIFYDIITTAAPHVYISALPLVSPDTLLYKTYIAESIAERPWVISRAMAPPHNLSGHKRWVNSISFAPDGSKIVTCSDDKTIRIWDVRGVPIGEPIPVEDLNVAVFSPDGWRVASWWPSGGMVRQWDVRTGTSFGKPLPAHHQAFAYSPDGCHIATAPEDGRISIWEATTGTATQQLVGDWRVVVHLACSPNGKHIASATDDNTVRIWDAETGLVVSEPVPHHVVYRSVVAWSPNGSQLAMTSEYAIRLLDVQTRQIIFHREHYSARSVAFSPGGSKLASAHVDDNLRIWNVSPSTGKRAEDHLAKTFTLGSKLASAHVDDNLEIWNVSPSTGKRAEDHLAKTFTRQIYTPQASVSYSGLGIACASRGESTVSIWREALTFTPRPQPSSDLASHRASNPSLPMLMDDTRQSSVSYSLWGWVESTVRTWGRASPFTPHPGPQLPSDWASHRASSPSLSMLMNHRRTLLYRDVVSDDGWVRTAAGQRVIWVPYAGGKVTVDSDSLTVVP